MDVGELLVNIRLKTEALEQGLNEVKRELKQNAEEVKSVSGEYNKFSDNVDKSLGKTKEHIHKHSMDIMALAMGYQSLSFTAIASLTAIAVAVKKGVDAFNQYNNSMIGLKSIVNGTGNSFKESQAFIEKFIDDGLVPASNAATALRNLLSRGFGMDQAVDILNRLKDSAAFGRQASLSLGDAIQSATEGLKNENSILIDNAGVTKNVSQMWKEYAQSIGKGVDSLTLAEKRQAEYTGLMKETQHQIGDAAKYAKEFAGSQAEVAAQTLKLQKAFGESLVPSLQSVMNLIKPIISGLEKYVSSNQEAIAATTAGLAVFTGLIAVLTSIKAAALMLGPALETLKVGLIGLATNPVVLGLTAIAAAATFVTSKIVKAKQEQEAYNASLEEFNRIKSDGVTAHEASAIEEQTEKLKKIVSEYDRVNAAIAKFEEEQEKINSGSMEWNESMGRRADVAFELKDSMENVNKALKEQNLTYDEAKERVSVYTEKLQELKRAQDLLSLSEIQNQSKTIAEKRAAIMETENLISAYKKAEQGSNEWVEAQQKLSEQFPQFSSASGIAIDAIEAFVKANNDSVKNEWNLLQQKIEIAKQEVQLQIAKKEAILETIEASRAQMDMEDSADSHHKRFADQVIQRNRDEIDQQKKALEALSKLGKTDISSIQGVKTVRSYSSSGSSGSSSSEYEDAQRVYEHKKRLQQLTLEDELSVLEAISQKYARTADEKMRIEEQIFDVKQQIIERDKKAQAEEQEAYAKTVKASEDAIKRKAQASLNWIEDKKRLGELNFEDEISTYDKLIQEHKSYLSSILNDEKINVEEKQRIRDDEENSIRDLEIKKYNIRKEYADKERQEAVNAVNKTSEQVLAALRSKYEKEKELQEKALDNEVKALDKWKDESLKRIEKVYDGKIKLIEETSKAQEKALKKEIDAIDEQIKQRDRATIDTEQLDKINNLQQKIAFEHDEFNKAELQKQLNNLIRERDARLYKEQLEDKKDSLNKQIDVIRENADKQKELLEEKKQSEIDALTAVYISQKTILQQSIADVNIFYANKLSAANLAAEQEVLLTKGTQETILDLLQNYYPNFYELAGKTLGEKLVEGFQDRVSEIQNIIASLVKQVDSAKAAAVSAASSILAPKETAKSTTAGPTTIQQTNNFYSTIPSPSEVARRVASVSRDLANQLG